MEQTNHGPDDGPSRARDDTAERPQADAPLAWGAHVSDAFRRKVRAIGAGLGIDPSWLMACIAFESARTFRADVRNAAGSGAVGLIQFMPQTCAAYGLTPEQMASMSPERQLDFVSRYFEPWRGKIRSIEDLYMVILWPAAVGRPLSHVLFDRRDPYHPARYVQNAGLDYNQDGRITKAEAAARVRRELEVGLRPENAC